MKEMVVSLISSLIIIISVLLALAYLTLAERKVMGSMQRRVGPNVVGIYGLGQPIMDGVKLILKESITPIHANKVLYNIAPIGSLVLALILWCIIPISNYVYLDLTYDIIYILAVSSVSILTVLWSGWSSNSKYSFLGSLRSTSQMISYEVVIGFIILTVIFLSNGTPNLTHIINSQISVLNIFPLFPLFLMFLIGIVAETNRAPFDLPEAESELVSGFNTEYSAAPFALWFISEYGNIIFMSLLTVNLFLGGYLLFLPFILFYFIWIRAAYPRYRYSDLMAICWQNLLPLTIGFIVIVPSILIILVK